MPTPAGEVMLRRSLTLHLTAATCDVFDRESPPPLLPGYPVPGQIAQPDTTGFPADPFGATPIPASDDSPHEVTFSEDKTFPFFGAAYDSVFISPNG